MNNIFCVAEVYICNNIYLHKYIVKHSKENVPGKVLEYTFEG